jgi:type I restriction enzyme S subunit
VALSSSPLVLNTKAIAKVTVPVPPENDAVEIGLFLKSLDDRISLLRGTNTTLEAIAQALFKSWFVDFDPVRAKQEGREPEGMDAATAALFPSEFEDSELANTPSVGRVSPTGVTRQIRDEASDGNVWLRCANPTNRLGLVPRGWRVGKVEDLIELAYGKALRATDRLSGNIPVYGSGGITGYHNEPLVNGPVSGDKGGSGRVILADDVFGD